jgi:hypothetical protein
MTRDFGIFGSLAMEGFTGTTGSQTTIQIIVINKGDNSLTSTDQIFNFIAVGPR